MKIYQMALAGITMSVLSACGGSGGGNDGVVDVPNNSSGAPNGTTNTTPPKNTPIKGEITTYAIELTDMSKSDSSFRTRDAEVNPNNDFTKVILDGEEYLIKYKRFMDNAEFNGGFAGYNGGDDPIRYGILKNTKGRYYALVQSREITPQNEMPQSGVATYLGSAVIGASFEHKNQVVWGTADAKANFSVDFGKKTIEGTIKPELTSQEKSIDMYAPKVEIHANISGNQFNGIHPSGTKTVGGFFGSHAVAMSGVYSNEETKAFGAFLAAKKPIE